MTEDRLPVDLPPASTTIHLSGQGLAQADLAVDQQVFVAVQATVTKAGLAATDDGPRPFANLRVTSLSLLGDPDLTARLFAGRSDLRVGISLDAPSTPEQAADAVIAAVRDDRRRRAREQQQ